MSVDENAFRLKAKDITAITSTSNIKLQTTK